MPTFVEKLRGYFTGKELLIYFVALLIVLGIWAFGMLYSEVREGQTRKFDERIYTELTSDHPIDLCRYQVANCYMGRAGLINSGGESKGAADLQNAVITAVVNKRAGGMGLISGRKAFQRPMKEGVALLNAIQDVYLSKEVSVA